MRKLLIGAAMLAASSFGAQAQTQQDLNRDGNGGSTDNVLTYGMGYHQQRFSKLDQINKGNVRKLVPVWSLSLESELGEQAQPMVYEGVIYAANAKFTVAVEAATGKVLWRTPVNFDPASPRVVC